VFYEKLPFYDLTSHTHKFIKHKEGQIKPPTKSDNSPYGGEASRKKQLKLCVGGQAGSYDPPLPVSIVKEEYNTKEGIIYNGGKPLPINDYSSSGRKGSESAYDPPLPNSIVKEEKSIVKEDLCIRKENSTYGNSMITTKKKEDHQQKYDPPLPTSIVKEESGDVVVNEKYTYKQDKEKDLYGTDIRKEVRTGKNVGKSSIYDPPLPNSVIKGENNTYNTEGRKTPITREPPNKYDPPLPVSVVKEDKYCDEIINNNIIKDTKHGTNTYNTETGRKQPLKHTGSGAFGGEGACYDPPLPNSMLEIKSTRGKHSTEKPVALMEWILKYYSKEGDVVLDPTCGSGSTGVACKNMKRNFIGIEMDEEIFKMAQSRII